MRRWNANAPRTRRVRAAASACLLAVAACAHPGAARTTGASTPVHIAAQESGTTALLQDVSAVNERVVWVGGHAATWVVTTDGGATWHSTVMPGADSLEFRDVYAADAKVAYLLSSGLGERSRIYKTVDGGATWQRQYTASNPKAFFDCFAFWDAEHGIVMGDEVDGHFTVLTTSDGGAHWDRVPDAALPAAQDGEGGFAASGTCVMTGASGEAWIGTGNAPTTRVLHTTDGGRTWTAVTTPIHGAVGAGISSHAIRDARHIVALGGPTTKLDASEDEVAITSDGGRTWTVGGRLPFAGPVYGAAYAPHGGPWLLAVGPRGAAGSVDDGRTWQLLDLHAYWSVGFADAHTAWAVGPSGRIVRIILADR